MSYLQEYQERRGVCKYCSRHNTGYGGCHECYGSEFKDSMDLFTFIKTRIASEAEAEFDESEIGKQLYDRYSRTKNEYLEAEHDYSAAKTDFAYKRIESLYEQINQLGVKND